MNPTPKNSVQREMPMAMNPLATFSAHRHALGYCSCGEVSTIFTMFWMLPMTFSTASVKPLKASDTGPRVSSASAWASAASSAVAASASEIPLAPVALPSALSCACCFWDFLDSCSLRSFLLSSFIEFGIWASTVSACAFMVLCQIAFAPFFTVPQPLPFFASFFI